MGSEVFLRQLLGFNLPMFVVFLLRVPAHVLNLRRVRPLTLLRIRTWRYAKDTGLSPTCANLTTVGLREQMTDNLEPRHHVYARDYNSSVGQGLSPSTRAPLEADDRSRKNTIAKGK